MHSSRMRTARSSSRPGGVSTRHPPGPGTLPWDQTPPRNKATPCEQNYRQVQNTTLPQTSFAGGN